jgi:hypothetical protein
MVKEDQRYFKRIAGTYYKGSPERMNGVVGEVNTATEKRYSSKLQKSKSVVPKSFL